MYLGLTIGTINSTWRLSNQWSCIGKKKRLALIKKMKCEFSLEKIVYTDHDSEVKEQATTSLKNLLRAKKKKEDAITKKKERKQKIKDAQVKREQQSTQYDGEVVLKSEKSRGGNCPFCGMQIQVVGCYFESTHHNNPYNDERVYVKQVFEKCWNCNKRIRFRYSI